MAYTLQLKRHVNYANKEAALAGLKAYLATATEGEPAIATYGRGSGSADIENDKVLFGIKGSKGYTIFDADTIPSEAQAALDAAIAAIKGNGEINPAYDTIKEIADALVKINGSGDGSISKAKQEAKDYADEKVAALDFTDAAVAGQYVDSVSETDGVISVTRKPITSTDKSVVLSTTNGVDLSVNIDGTTILRDSDSGKLSVASAALVQYVGANAIKVSEVQDGNKTISLAINTNDKVLTQNADGLLANIDLTWDKTNGLKLTGNNGEVIATVPAADFIKDGMLENVTLEKNPDGQTAGTYLHFVFNTDAKETDKKTDIYVNVTELIDVYTAGDGISVSGKVITAKLDGSTEAFLTVGPNGIKLSGVQDAIDAAKQEVQTAINTAKQEAQTAIDTVEASVGLAADGSHVKTTGNYTKDATTVVGEIAALDTQVKKNADAIDQFTGNAGAIEELYTQVKTEISRATDEENRIAKTVIGEGKLEAGKSVMDVILENEETAQQAIKQLATAAGVLSGEQIKYTAPTNSGEFSSTTSIMDMLNTIDKKWNTIDCGTY